MVEVVGIQTLQKTLETCQKRLFLVSHERCFTLTLIIYQNLCGSHLESNLYASHALQLTLSSPGRTSRPGTLQAVINDLQDYVLHPNKLIVTHKSSHVSQPFRRNLNVNPKIWWGILNEPFTNFFLAIFLIFLITQNIAYSSY